MRTHQVCAEGKIGALIVIVPTCRDSVADYEDNAGDLDDASVCHGSIGRPIQPTYQQYVEDELEKPYQGGIKATDGVGFLWVVGGSGG